CNNNGLAAVALIELLGLDQVVLGEKQGFLTIEKPRPGSPADVITERVPDDGSNRDGREEKRHIPMEQVRGDPGRNEQGIAGKEEANQQPGLCEHDEV